MLKKEFESLYSEKLKLSEKNWFLMPERSVLSNNKVIISGHKEIDFDYLYFVVKDEVWEMYLKSNLRFVEQDFLLPCDLFGRCINQKKDFSYGVDRVEFKNSGIKGQVIVILDHFATKVVNILEPKSEDTKHNDLITGKAGDFLFKNKITGNGEWRSSKFSEEDLSVMNSLKNTKADWTIPVVTNAVTIVPEEMFEKPSILSSADFDFNTNEYLKPGELNSKKKIREFEDKPTKISEGKLFYEIDWEFIEGLAVRMALNKQNGKYEVFGWRDKGVNIEEMNQALIRHLIAILKGELNDDEQEFSHYYALVANCMLIINQLNKNKKNELNTNS